jgi:hypothetical protein
MALDRAMMRLDVPERVAARESGVLGARTGGSQPGPFDTRILMGLNLFAEDAAEA